jgi:hypothetical protein
MKSLATHKVHALSALVLVFGLAASACNGQSLEGTWHEPDGTTKLPDAVGGGDLNVDATLVLDDSASPKAFELDLSLEFEGLNDTIDARGTYAIDGSNLTLTFTEFVIDPASGNSSEVAEDGSQCIYLMGFTGAPVCFPSPQTNPYVLDEDLTITIEQSIAGDAVSQTELTMTRTP